MKATLFIIENDNDRAQAKALIEKLVGSTSALKRPLSGGASRGPPNLQRSNRTRGPIVALTLRISRTVEYLALAASCRFVSSTEKAAPATSLIRIQRLFGVVVQSALPVLGLAKGAGIGAD